jgi:aryl-alcohol dehydrogenase-like predicted oxidoreductase
LPACLEQDLGVIVREPLANGYLSGGYRPGGWVTARDDWRSGHDPAEVQGRLELVEELRRTEVPEGMAMAQWAIGWCLQHPAVSGVVAGARWSVEQVQSNAAAADLDLIRGITPRLWCRSRDQAHSPELPCQCADQPRVAPKTRPRA